MRLLCIIKKIVERTIKNLLSMLFLCKNPIMQIRKIEHHLTEDKIAQRKAALDEPKRN